MILSSEVIRLLANALEMPPAPHMIPAVCIVHDGNRCEIYTVGADMMFRASCPAEGAPLAVLIPAEGLTKALQSVGESELTVTEGKALFKGNGKQATVLSLPADKAPQFQEIATTASFVADDIIAAMADTIYAIPAKDHRRVLMGINLEIADCKGEATATDGKKLSRRVVPIPEMEGKDCSTIVPPDFLKLAELMPVGAVLGVSSFGLRLTAGDADTAMEIRALSIQGKYPDCNQVIPKDRQRFAFDPEALAGLVKSSGNFSDNNTRSIVLSMEPGKISATAMIVDTGSFLGEIEWPGDSPTLEVGFNFRFLVEVLGKLKGDAFIEFKDAKSPWVFSSEGVDGMELLMPIKLADIQAGGAANPEPQEVQL